MRLRNAERCLFYRAALDFDWEHDKRTVISGQPKHPAIFIGKQTPPNFKASTCSCTQSKNNILAAGCRAHSFRVKPDSSRRFRQKNKASQFFIILCHLHVRAPANPRYHLPYCANKGACVKARASQFSSSHACHTLSLSVSLWQGFSTHMQVITISSPVPHE